MARPTNGARPVRFRGPPTSLAAVVAEGVDPLLDLRVSFTVGDPRKGRDAHDERDEREQLDAPVQTDLDPRILRLTLPLSVPPGRYEGTLYVGEQERAVRLDVEPEPALHAVPEQLRVDAHPGDLVGADLTLLNHGNVPVTVRGVQAIGIFMSGGIERALRRAYVHDPPEGKRRVDIIADNLAEAHGGLLKMKIENGAGDIAPGEVRELEVVLHVPSGLQRGAVYGGNWELAGMVYPITIHVPNGRGDEEVEEGPEQPTEPDRPVVRGGEPRGARKTAGRKSGGAGKTAGGKSSGARKTAGRKSGGGQKTASRKSGGGQKTAGRKSSGAQKTAGRKSGGGRKSAGRESGGADAEAGGEAREGGKTARASPKKTGG